MSENHQITDATAESCAPGKLKKTIVLVGMMGAGKTAVGRALAARLNVPFLDSDHEIEDVMAELVQLRDTHVHDVNSAALVGGR